MCGIAGELRFETGPTAADWHRISELMRNRGPDDSGLWNDDANCTLVFRRLSILDLSPRGHQPMIHSSGRYALVFNGEIYNFRELRQELSSMGESFLSTGDSEVVLKSLVAWDIAALDRFNGIFALAFYDKQDRSLLLARDHAGIKPLYYLRDRRGVVFGSQFDQILAHPWSREHAVDRDALNLYLRFGYIPAPYAMLAGSSMVEPGAWVRFDREKKSGSGRYWKLPFPEAPTLAGDEAFEAVDQAVTEAVGRQLVSDVPVGAFLSGGVDSPLVVAKMVEAGKPDIRTFTIAVDDEETDESNDARAYAQALGVDQVIETITPDRALTLLPDVIEASSEPFGDYSIFPTMLVSRLASREFKVMLSGDGGDELFWGYPKRSAQLIRFAHDFRRPYHLRRMQSMARKLAGRRSAKSLYYRTVGDWYRDRHTRLRENWLQRVFPDLNELPNSFSGYDYSGATRDEVAQWLRLNEFEYHLTMVLLKVDRASMHCSQEVRVPLLDREVIRVASQVDWQSCLDLESKIGKQPLRWSLNRHVKFQTRAKRGFEAPMADWLRGPLREQFESLVLSREDFFGERIDRESLRKLFARHLSGDEDHAWGLWPLLSLALWEQQHLATDAF